MIDVRTSNKLESVVLIPLDNEKLFDMKSVLRRYGSYCVFVHWIILLSSSVARMDLFLSLSSYSMGPDKDASHLF